VKVRKKILNDLSQTERERERERERETGERRRSKTQWICLKCGREKLHRVFSWVNVKERDH